jgi:hypothetical protein
MRSEGRPRDRFGFVLSHPCDGKNLQGWGTVSLWRVDGAQCGFVVSHPCARTKAQGWGTVGWWASREGAGC